MGDIEEFSRCAIRFAAVEYNLASKANHDHHGFGQFAGGHIFAAASIVTLRRCGFRNWREPVARIFY